MRTIWRKQPGWFAKLAQGYADRDDDDAATAPRDVFAHVAADRRQLFARAIGDLRRLATAGSIQARCLECGGLGPSASDGADAKLLDMVLARVGIGG